MADETPGSRGVARARSDARGQLTTGLGAESWQWLAFLFAAFVTLAFAFVDNFVNHKRREGSSLLRLLRGARLSLHRQQALPGMGARAA
jgi:hypothetical protein